MGFEHAARSIASDLDALELSYALIGGFAVSIRTDPRFTQDIDLVVAVADDDAAELAVNRLVARGYVILAVVEHETQGRLATVRLELPGESWVLDLLFASSGIESEIVDAADRVEVVRGLWLPVARAGHLIALKLLARDDSARPQDSADLRALVGVGDEDELILARHAVDLIDRHGAATSDPVGVHLIQIVAVGGVEDLDRPEGVSSGRLSDQDHFFAGLPRRTRLGSPRGCRSGGASPWTRGRRQRPGCVLPLRSATPTSEVPGRGRGDLSSRVTASRTCLRLLT